MRFLRAFYLSSARSWVRRLGIVRVVSWLGDARTQRRSRQYQRERPERVWVQVGPWAAELHVAGAVEYARALSVHEDRHILRFLLKHVRRGDACWDVGANVGLYTLLLARAAGEKGTVTSFEPEDRARARLAQNAALNGFRNIRVLGLALGRESTKMGLNASEYYSSGTHQLVKAAGGVSPAPEGMVLVDVAAGDEVLKKERLRVPAVIKIDVEGMEEDVLLGLDETLRRPECRCVVCEVHFSILESRGLQEAPARIGAYLREHGFNHAVWLDHSHLGAYKA